MNSVYKLCEAYLKWEQENCSGLQNMSWNVTCVYSQYFAYHYLSKFNWILISVYIIAQYNFLQCFFPYFVGDGNDCTVDEDGDGFPNVPLEICTQLNNNNASYCIRVSYIPLINRTCHFLDCVLSDVSLLLSYPYYSCN